MKAGNLVLAAGLILGSSLMPLGSALADTWVVCTPTGVASFSNRIHVRCSQSFSGIAFFAYKAGDSAGAARYMSLASSAMISGRNLRILYNPADQSGTAIGCQAGDCRLLTGMEMM